MELPVTYGERTVATIVADADRTDLIYHPDWLEWQDGFAISLTMPVRSDGYPAAVILPWLMNLLPEGEPLRAMTRVLGMSGEDVLGLLRQRQRTARFEPRDKLLAFLDAL